MKTPHKFLTLFLIILGLGGLIVWRVNRVTNSPNLLTNSDFESEGFPGWQFVGTRDTHIEVNPTAEDPNNTIVSLKIPETTGRGWLGLGQRLSIPPLQNYQVAVKYRPGETWPDSAKIILRITQFDQTGQTLTVAEISPPVAPTAAIWQHLTHNFVVAQESTLVEFGIGLLGNQAAVIELDNFTLSVQPGWADRIWQDGLALTATILLIALLTLAVVWGVQPLTPHLNPARADQTRAWPKELAFATLFTVGLFLGLEMLLRLGFSLPQQTFGFINGEGLYPRNTTLEMTWGPIPYTVRTNSLGFRGKEMPRQKPEGTLRIAALGDSVTDGFFVENEYTYPHLLEAAMNAAGGQVEVLNAAKGGGSIGKAYAILREFVLPLDPDLVILTFVTNDIGEEAKSALISQTLQEVQNPTGLDWLFTQTAIGELSFVFYLRSQSQSYQTSPPTENVILDQGRYQIAGGGDYASNVALFKERYAQTDEFILQDLLPPEAVEGIANYVFALEHLHNFCQTHNIQLVFVYFPSYSQIYDRQTSMQIRDILQETSQRLAIPFLDLTPTFREVGQDTILHLAPVDFHLNPEGNRVMAQAIADFLITKNLLNEPD